METRTCPKCGHQNLPRAVFCFRCGMNLDDLPVMRGIHRQRRHIEDAMRHIQGRENSLEPELIRKLREAKAKLPPDIDSMPITCLRCGTLNKPLAAYCIGCGAALSIPEDPAAMKLVPRSSADSDLGQLRENNEDRVGLWGRQGVVLALVADGMGGAAAGEEASRLVTEAVQADFLGEARGSETLNDLPEEEVIEKLRQTVRRANRAVIHHSDDHVEFQGMGTTLTLAFVRNNRVIVAHVGDSRAYLVDGREAWINQITDDHSFVEALLASGHITPEQAAVHPMRNVLYRALGQLEETEPDFYTRNLNEGDRLILCSDGLTRHVTPPELMAIARQYENPETIAQKLIELANSRGGEDNISVVVIVMERAEDLQPEDPPASILFEDTAIGLFQAPEIEDLDPPTLELPDDNDTPVS